MAMDIGANFKITAGVSGQGVVDRLSASLRGASDNTNGLSASFGSLKGVLAGLGITAAAVSIANFARATINNADALNDMAERTGIAAASLSELQFAAQMNGADLGDVEVALKKLSGKAFDAATGNKAAAATFDALGISVRDAGGQLKASDTLLQELADVLNTVQDRTTRTALANEILGKSGDRLISMFENMRSAREEARRLGIVIGEDMQKAAAEFNDNVDRMTFMAKSFATSLANEVMPTLNRFMTEIMAGRQIFGGYWEALKNIGMTNPFATPAENAAKYRERLSALEAEARKLEGTNTRAAANRRNELKEEIDNTRKLLEYFERMSGKTTAPAASPPGGTGQKPMDGKALLERIRAANEKAAGKQSDFDTLKRGYEDSLARVQELSEAEKLLRDIQLGRYKDLTPAQKKQLEEMARELDAKRALAENEKSVEELQRRVAEQREAAAKREQEELDKTVERYKDLADPVAKYRRELEEVRSLLEEGLIDQATFEGSVKAINETIDKLKDGQDQFKKLEDAINGWGRQATDAFVDFAFNAKTSFGDMVSSILRDLARLVIQQNVMGPLFSAIGDSMKGGGVQSFFKSLLPFANGGIMTSAGPLPLNTYAGGGIANRPQVALFGEGRMPEAYVPLPDGRSIPVTMQGGGTGAVNVNVVVNAQTGQTEKNDSGMFGKLGASIAGVVRQEIINQKRPGGLLAT